MMKLKRLILLAMLLALAIGLNFLESLIPSIGIPGVKLGLANIVILITLYKFKFKEALIIMFLRVLIVGLIRGTFLSISFFMSLVGALLAFFSMYLIKKIKIFKIASVSVVGAIMHCIGQIIVAIIALSTIEVGYYLPIIMLLSIATGVFNGIVSDRIMKIGIFNELEKKQIEQENIKDN